MCLALPGRIIELRDEAALVDFRGNRLEVSTVLTPEAGAGDWVLVHAGFAIARLDEETARQTWTYLAEVLGEPAPNTANEARPSDA